MIVDLKEIPSSVAFYERRIFLPFDAWDILVVMVAGLALLGPFAHASSTARWNEGPPLDNQ